MALREILAHFGFTVDRSNLDAAGRGVERVKGGLAGAAAQLSQFAGGLRGAIAGVAGGAFLSFTNEVKEQAAALKDTSDQTGLSTDALQAWTLQAQLGGASAQDFVAGLRKISKELATGVDESGQQSKLFKQLGIDTKDAAGNVRELEPVLSDLAEKFVGLKSGAEKSALAQQLFGRAGTKLVPLLSQGAAGVAELRRQFEALGGGFSQEAIDAADEYDDSLIKLQFSFLGLKSLLATSVFPWLAKTVGALTEASVTARAWIKETTFLSSAVKSLAVLIGATLLKSLAPFLLPGLKFLAIFLAVDDLLAFLDGKDSVIGAILNGWFGDGTAKVVRAWCNDAAAAIKGTLIGALDLLKIAFSDNDEASKKLWQHFELATRPVERILDGLIDKIKTIKDALTNWDTLKKGANDALDVAESAVSAVTGAETRADRRNRKLFDQKYDLGPAPKGPPLKDFLSDAFRNPGQVPALAGGGAPKASAPTAAVPGSTVTNNISPVTVQQSFAAGTDASVRKLAKDAAKEGVTQGLSEYRTALQNLTTQAVR